MTTGRRERLDRLAHQNLQTHAGLWFDRYFLTTGGDEAKRNLMRECAAIGMPEVYQTHYAAWQTSLPTDCRCAIAEVCGRMVIGTGDKGVAEAGLTLHHTYGVPYIPGSALKGLASAYAHMRLEGFTEPEGKRIPERKPNEGPPEIAPYHTLFGAENSAGYVTFFDALYMPGTTKDDRPLAPDVITGHHSDYYVGDTPRPPADWDSPTPVPFLTATGRYLIAIAGPQEWLQTALTIIGLALHDHGIGAKTAVGYGRMRLLTQDGEPFPLPVAHVPKPDQPQSQIAKPDVKEQTDTTLVLSSTSSIHAVGTVFTGKVVERGKSVILISVPDHPAESVLATLTIADDTPSWRPGDLARVEVTGVEERSGRTILTVRRAPKAKKS